MRTSKSRLRSHRLTIGALLAAASVVALTSIATDLSASVTGDQTQLPSTTENFIQPGTQPETDPNIFKPMMSSSNCTYCHAEFDTDTAPYDSWVTSMMGQSARDPVWHAALSISNQDAHLSGETCIRCHAPGAWLEGKSTDGTIDDFDGDDFDGVNCNFCHRSVNPIPCDDPDPLHPENCYTSESALGYPPANKGGDSGPEYPDSSIIAALQDAGNFPTHVGNATFIVDPDDVRRGPYDDISAAWYSVHGLDGYGNFVWLVTSPYHRMSKMCGQCHDVSNPLFVRNPKTGEYDLAPYDQPHPTGDPNDMFPEQRTYSEWLISDFADTGVYFEDGRFGGANSEGLMRTCQDCHMPKQVGAACVFEDNPKNPQRDDIGQHSFAGANTWVIDAVAEQAGDDAFTLGLTEDRIQSAKARTVQMLKDASDMELSVDSNGWLDVRIINQTGHKLPTGYPEGRRMWINVQYFDEYDVLIGESGAYDYASATLNEEGTKIYEMRSGISDEVAAATNLPAGPSSHLSLNNVRLFDNRIPPRGATYAELESVSAENVGYSYPDNQYWDDTLYVIPPNTRSAVATLYYQTSTREYMEFLRNTTEDSTGSIAHTLWLNHGMSAPEPMDVQVIELPEYLPGDINRDGAVDGIDLSILLGSWGKCECPADVSGDGTVDGLDLSMVLGGWTF